jgi:myo-inositol-1(or 4)-monophosphatase
MMSALEHLVQDVAQLARNAGELIMKLKAGQRLISYKSARDMVTEVDRSSEDLIVSFIQDKYPDHDILAEESETKVTRSSEYLWIIDPLDGTTNFVHDFPAYCVSIGVVHDGEVIAAAIYDPLRNEMFEAGKGQGAFLNGEPIQVSPTGEMSRTLLATGFPYANDEAFDLNMRIWTGIYGQTQGLRRAGAAALDMAWTACGRLDGFWEFSLQPWDIAAGVLLVKEAGGLVSSPIQARFDLFEGNIIASNSIIHQVLREEIRTHL